MISETGYRFALMLLVITGLGLVSPAYAAADGEGTSVEDIQRETAELLQALKSYGTEQRDKALERSSTALRNLDRRIETLESRMLEQWDEMDQAARDRSRASLQALREQRTRVAEWYGSLKSSSAGAWSHIRQGFSSAYETLLETWEESEAQISPGGRK